jgi:drug/metabolite transporter (DMT)-like permease
MGQSSAGQSPALGRLLIILAAVGWSTSGAFAKVLREPTPLGLNVPPVHPLQIASGRALFAGLALLPLLRRGQLSFSPAMGVTAVCFTAMNVLFVSAISLGPAANAILLQYTAPIWLYLAGVSFLKEQPQRHGATVVLLGAIGIGVIVLGGWQGGQLPIVLLGLGSGVGYAAVLLGLRVQRGVSVVWVTVVNHLFAGLVLLPFALRYPPPTPAQLGWLFLFGTLQMGLPYALMARGLRSVSPQEAGTLTLLEPLLNPVWAYLASPATETPGWYTLTGGLFILGALAWRYWPTLASGGRQLPDGPGS